MTLDTKTLFIQFFSVQLNLLFWLCSHHTIALIYLILSTGATCILCVLGNIVIRLDHLFILFCWCLIQSISFSSVTNICFCLITIRVLIFVLWNEQTLKMVRILCFCFAWLFQSVFVFLCCCMQYKNVPIVMSFLFKDLCSVIWKQCYATCCWRELFWCHLTLWWMVKVYRCLLKLGNVQNMTVPSSKILCSQNYNSAIEG